MAKLYIIGSLRNPAIPTIAKKIRKAVPDMEVFDDWFAAGPTADDSWKEYEQARGRTYEEALRGYAAQHVFDFDTTHLSESTHALLVLPAGKSGHMELMYAQYGVGAHTAILLEEGADPRWDVMYQFVPDVLSSMKGVEEWLHQTKDMDKAAAAWQDDQLSLWDNYPGGPVNLDPWPIRRAA